MRTTPKARKSHPVAPVQRRHWTLRLGGVAAGVLAVTTLGGACGGSTIPTTTTTKPAPTTATTAVTKTTAAPTTARPSEAMVTVRQFQFMPKELMVKADATVTWTNQDQILHTATSGATPGTADGTFDGPMGWVGQSFTFTFEQPGTYPYFCSRHTSMTGTIVVQ